MRADFVFVTFGSCNNGGAKSTMEIRNFILRRSQVTKMEQNRLGQSFMYKDLRQRAQRIYSACLPL